MNNQSPGITTLDRWEARIQRRLQLIRGQWASWRGVQAGERFGLGRGVRIHFPAWLQVGSDVTIEDHGFLHCLSADRIVIGDRTSFDRNLWVHSGCTPTDVAHGFFHVGHDSYVGCNAVIGSSGGVRIGNHVQIGPNLLISSENHVFDDPSLRIDEQGVSRRGVVVEDDCWIGSNVTILDGVTIATGAVLAAGCVVTKDVPAYSVVAGVPAKILRQRSIEGGMR